MPLNFWKATIPTLLFYAGYGLAIGALLALSKYGFETSNNAFALLILLPVCSGALLLKNLFQLVILKQPQQAAVCLHLLVCLYMLTLI